MLNSFHLKTFLFALVIIQSGWLSAQTPTVSETVSNAFENANGNGTYLSSQAVIDHDGNLNMITTYFGAYQLVIVKYTPSGELLNQIPLSNITTIALSGYQDVPKYMLMDDQNNYYVMGYQSLTQILEIEKISAGGVVIWQYFYPSFSSYPTFAFDPQGNIVTAGAVQVSGVYKGFLTKLSPGGTVIWSKNYSHPDYDLPVYNKIFTDQPGNIYAIGSGNNLTTFNGYFLAEKYNSNGDLIWSNLYNASASPATDYAVDAVLSPSGSLYATGTTRNGNLLRITTIKYNVNGIISWAKNYSGAGIATYVEQGHALFIDENENVYVAAESDNPVTTLDLTAIKYNKNGVQQWVSSYPYTLQPNYSTEMVADAVLDGNNNLIITGVANDTAGSPSTYFKKELYLRFDPQGNIINADLYHAGENLNQQPYDLIPDASGNTYSVGCGTDPFNHLPSLFLIKRNATDAVLYERNYQVPLTGKEYHKSALVDEAGNFYSANNITDPHTSVHPMNSYRFDQNGTETQFNNYNFGNLNRMVRDRQHRILICGITQTTNPQLVICDSTGMQTVPFLIQLSKKGYATDVASDPSGDIYITGYYKTKNDSADVFLAKYNSSGTQIWNVVYKGPGLSNDEAYSMSIDDASNIFITGRTQTGVTHYPLLLKYTSSGNLLWSLIAPSSNNAQDFGYDVLADNNGGCYVTGRFTQTIVNQKGFVIIKVSASGTIVKKLYRTGNEQTISDFGTHLFLDNQNNLYAEGRVMKDGKPYGISLMKMKNNLQLNWSFEKSGYNYAFDDSIGLSVSYNDPLQFAVDSKGNVYVANVLNNSYDVKISKLNKNGSVLWNYTSTATDVKILPSPNLICDNEDNLWSIFNIFNESITAYDWQVLKFDDGQSPQKMGFMDIDTSGYAIENLLHIYPNPVQESVTLTLNAVSAGEVEIIIIDFLGKVVYHSVENGKLDYFTKTISLSEFPSGIYSVEVSTKNTHSSQKLIKQ